MFKRILLGIVVVSALALFWAEANAQTCVRWRRSGGSNTCLQWSTGSIILELTFKQDCGAAGEGAFGPNCNASIHAQSTNSVVFCKNPSTQAIRKSAILCTALVTFDRPADSCEYKHEQDGTTDGGVGHEAGHKCESNTRLTAQNKEACQTSCNAGEVVEDVTPIEMNTNVLLSVSGGGDILLTQADDGTPECDPESSTCEVEQHCTISPSRIQFQKIRQYHCEITFVGSGVD